MQFSSAVTIVAVILLGDLFFSSATPQVPAGSGMNVLEHTDPCCLLGRNPGWQRQGQSLSASVPSFRIGVLCSYSANQNLSSQVKNIRRLVNSNMRDLHTFANDTPMVSSF